MIFKRKVYNQLLEWKNNYSKNYAILLEGARRVGKTTIAKLFAKNEYKSHIYIDFSKANKKILDVFDDIDNLDLFFLRLESETGIHLYEDKSLIVFDEVQFFPKARQAIKHLVADGRYRYLETGSLISIHKNVKDILIPSEEMKIQVNPLDYEEFNWAINSNYDLLREIMRFNKPIGQGTNRRLMRDLRIYMAVGGMPQAVNAYIEKKTFQEIDTIKKNIIELYKDDFRKIDKTGRICMIYDSIPSHLAQGKNKFYLSKALNKRISKKDKELLYDLIDSKTILICNNVLNPQFSFSSSKNVEQYKLYLSDIGLFTTMIFNNKKIISENIYNKLLGDKLDANLGYLYENAMAQIIKSNDIDLYYYMWKENENCRWYEIDFLVSNQNKIIPIEVKSSNVNNHKSILEFSKKYSSYISRRILFSQKDVSNEQMLELKPIYLAPIILEEFE